MSPAAFPLSTKESIVPIRSINATESVPRRGHDLSPNGVAGVAFAAVMFGFLTGLFLYFLLRRRQRRKVKDRQMREKFAEEYYHNRPTARILARSSIKHELSAGTPYISHRQCHLRMSRHMSQPFDSTGHSTDPTELSSEHERDGIISPLSLSESRTSEASGLLSPASVYRRIGRLTRQELAGSMPIEQANTSIWGRISSRMEEHPSNHNTGNLRGMSERPMSTGSVKDRMICSVYSPSPRQARTSFGMLGMVPIYELPGEPVENGARPKLSPRRQQPYYSPA